MTLYLVPTPIGNLEDITLRALRVLREAALIAAEDTRTTRILLQHYDIATPLTSYHEHNKLSKLEAIFAALAAGDVALVSDAGTPGISDPGAELVAEAIRRGVRVEPLPGANAITTALVGSGLPTEGFVFLGFPPRKDKALREFFETVRSEPRTLIAYESPNRLLDTLAAATSVFGGERPACVARELSKIYEEFVRGTLAQVQAHFSTTAPRGEIVLLIGGAPEIALALWDEAQVRAELAVRLAAGEHLRDAARDLAEVSGWERRAVYEIGIQLRSAE